MKYLHLAAGVVALIGCQTTSEQLEVRVIDYGRFTAAFSQGRPGDFRIDLDRVVAGEEIPCRIGESFGVMYSIDGFPSRARRATVVEHWELPSAGGSPRVHENRYTLEPHDGKVEFDIMLWTFERGQDLLPGIWTAELRRGQDVLFKQPFQVVGCP